jgi:hypothetical protein
MLVCREILLIHLTEHQWGKVEIHHFFDSFHLNSPFLSSPQRYFYAAALWTDTLTAVAAAAAAAAGSSDEELLVVCAEIRMFG